MTLWTARAGALSRALLASIGAIAALRGVDWPLSTACFALLSVILVVRTHLSERRVERYRALSRRDPLTGVGNYRSLHERLQEVASADVERFALLTLDVDRFKQINENHGHLEGDRLLQEVGRVLTENVRGSDVVARQGGDEFSVLLPEADADGAALLALRIEEALATIEAADHAPVRASIGMAVFPQDGATPTDLLEKADLDLRRTKELRRALAAAA